MEMMILEIEIISLTKNKIILCWIVERCKYVFFSSTYVTSQKNSIDQVYSLHSTNKKET